VYFNCTNLLSVSYSGTKVNINIYIEMNNKPYSLFDTVHCGDVCGELRPRLLWWLHIPALGRGDRVGPGHAASSLCRTGSHLGSGEVQRGRKPILILLTTCIWPLCLN